MNIYFDICARQVPRHDLLSAFCSIFNLESVDMMGTRFVCAPIQGISPALLTLDMVEYLTEALYAHVDI